MDPLHNHLIPIELGWGKTKEILFQLHYKDAWIVVSGSTMQNIVGQAFKDHNALAKSNNEKIAIIALVNWGSIQNNLSLIKSHVRIVKILLKYRKTPYLVPGTILTF